MFKRPQVLSASIHLPPLASLLVIVLLLVTVTACGKKGPVRPKLATQPSAPQSLTAQQQGEILVLGWTIPSTNEDGSEVEDLTGFRIKRLAYDIAHGCPTCRDPQAVVAELDLLFPTPGQRIGDRIYWRDLNVLPDQGYRYAVVPLTVSAMEGPLATIHLAMQQAPSAPTGLQASAGDGQVELQWQAPSLPEGTKLVGYNLYRRQMNRLLPIIPVNAKPLQKTTLLDRGLDNDRSYEYRVSALVEAEGQRLESAATSPILVAPKAR